MNVFNLAIARRNRVIAANEVLEIELTPSAEVVTEITPKLTIADTLRNMDDEAVFELKDIIGNLSL